MNHDEANQIIENLKGQGAVVAFGRGQEYVRLDGHFSINELHAVLQLMEYDA